MLIYHTFPKKIVRTLSACGVRKKEDFMQYMLVT